MVKNIFAFFALFFISATVFGQHKFAFNIGYDKVGVHSGYAGAEYRINSNAGENRHGPLNVGVGTYLYAQNGKFAAAPEVHLNKTWRHVLLTELSVSTQNIRPSVGVGFFNLGRMQFGYSFPVHKREFKGFYFGFHILVGRAPFYDEIKVFGK